MFWFVAGLIVALNIARAVFLFRARTENPHLVDRIGNPLLIGRFHRFLFASNDPEYLGLTATTRVVLRLAQGLSAATTLALLLWLVLIAYSD